MALSTATVTFDLADHLGVDFEVSRTRLWVTTNVPDDVVADGEAHQIRLGSGQIVLNSDGTGSFTTWVGEEGVSNPASWQTTLHVDYIDGGRRERKRKSFGPYTITADAYLDDLMDEQEIPPNYVTSFTADMETIRDEAEAARDAAVDISNIDTSDGVVSTLIEGTGGAGPLTRSALTASYAARAGNIDATIRKTADDFADVNILVLGDSTAAQTGQWADVLFPQIQALYPHRTLEKATWDNTGHAWGSFSQVGASGTGSYKIKFWQGAVSGTVCEQPLNYLDAWIGSVQPDLVVVHYGHNYGATAAAGGQPSNAVMDQVFRERYLRFVAEIKRVCPRADVLLTSQNPYLTAGTRDQISNVRAQAVREIAADLGCAYGPILEAYEALGDETVQATYLNVDGLHPKTSGATNGAAVGAAALLPMFRFKAAHEIGARIPSPFVQGGVNLLTNGDFIEFATPPTLTGWTAANVTLSKDTTNYESANGYSVKGTCTAAAVGQVYQFLPIKRVRGRVVTFVARWYVEAAVVSSQPGRVQLSGDGGFTTITSGTITSVRDNFVWTFVTAYVPAATTFVTASLIFGTASGEYASCDRAAAILGHMPRDPAARAALTTYVNQIASTEDALTSGQMVPRRDLMQVNSVSHATGTLGLTFFTGDKTETIGNVTAYTGSTAAAATPTLARIGIYSVDGSGNLTLVAATANDTTLFAAANTAYTRALTSSFSKVAGSRYAVGLLVTSGAAMPTFMGPLAVSNPPAQSQQFLAPMQIARLTGQTDLPSSIAVGSLVSYSQRAHVLLTP